MSLKDKLIKAAFGKLTSEIEKYKKYDAEKNTSTESVDEEQKNHTERLVDSIKYLGRLSKNRLMIE